MIFDYFIYPILQISLVLFLFFLVSKKFLNTLKNKISILFISLFIFKVILAYVLNIYNLIPLNYNSDALRYHEIASVFYESYFNNFSFKSLLSYYSFFPFLISIIYLFFGPYIYVGVLINTFIYQLAILNIYSYTKLKIGEYTALKTLIFLSLLPTFIFFPLTLIREIFIVYLMSELFLIIDKNSRIFKKFFLCFFIFMLRPYMGIIILFLMLVHKFISRKNLFLNLKEISVAKFFASLFIVLPLFIIFSSTIFTFILNYTPLAGFSGSNIFEIINLTRSAMSGTVLSNSVSSSYGADWVINDFLSLFVVLIKSIANFFFGPTILNAHNFAARIISIEKLIITFLSFFFVLRFKSILIILKNYSPFFFGVAILIFYSLVTTDYGTAIRFNLQILPWILPLLLLNLKKL